MAWLRNTVTGEVRGPFDDEGLAFQVLTALRDERGMTPQWEQTRLSPPDTPDASGDWVVMPSDTPSAYVPTSNGDGTFSWLPSSGGSGSQPPTLIALGTGAGPLASGTDQYPDLTAVTQSGSGISLGEDAQTISLDAGTYDIAVVYDVAMLDPGATGFLQVYFDSLEFPHSGSSLLASFQQALSLANTATIFGFVLGAPATTKLNFEVDDLTSGNWSLSPCLATIRKQS
jgi:hypothetical protein